MAEVARRGLPPNEGHVGPVATGMREEHGPDIWAMRTVEWIRSGAAPGVDSSSPGVGIDGVRSRAEIDRFRTELASEFVLIAIVADDAQRHSWITGRGREDDEADPAWARARDERERGWGIDDAIAAADHTIANDADIETLKARIGMLLDEVLATP